MQRQDKLTPPEPAEKTDIRLVLGVAAMVGTIAVASVLFINRDSETDVPVAGPGLTTEDAAPAPTVAVATTIAATTTPDTPQDGALRSHPILVDALAIARGRSDSEVILSVRFGNLTLAFATEVSTLVDLCGNLISKVEPGKPTSAN